MQNDNCFWWQERAERTGANITSGDSSVDSDRDKYRLANDFRSGSGPQLAVSRASTATTTTYEGQAYAIRNFTKPYRLLVNQQKVLKGGSNTPAAKRNNFAHTEVNTRGRFDTVGPKIRIVADSINYEKDCSDVINPNKKERLEGTFVDVNQTTINGDVSEIYEGGKSTIFAPFTLFSSSNTPAYMTGFRSNTQLANYHDDSYGDDQEVPVQGPFTNAHVGGWRYRHQDINSDASDTTLTRAEAWDRDWETSW